MELLLMRERLTEPNIGAATECTGTLVRSCWSAPGGRVRVLPYLRSGGKRVGLRIDLDAPTLEDGLERLVRRDLSVPPPCLRAFYEAVPPGQGRFF